MIEINLIPKGYTKKEPEKKKEKKVKRRTPLSNKNIPFIGLINQFSLKTWIIVGASFFSLITVAIFLTILVFPNASMETKIRNIEARQKSIEKNLSLAIKYRDQREKLEALIKDINNFRKERTAWAPVLNDLSNSAPVVLQLTRFYFRVVEKKVELPKKKKKQRSKFKIEKENYLILEGLLPEDENESVINNFIDNLINTVYFPKVFEKISLESVVSQDDGVKRFRVQCDVFKNK